MGGPEGKRKGGTSRHRASEAMFRLYCRIQPAEILSWELTLFGIGSRARPIGREDSVAAARFERVSSRASIHRGDEVEA